MNRTCDFRSAIGGGKPRRSGVVLPTVLVVMLTICLVTGLVARFSIRSMRLARRALDVERAFVVAEAGLGYGVMRVRNMLNAELVSGLQRDYATISAPASPDPEFQLSLKVVLGEGTNEVGSVETGFQYVTVFAGARNLESGVSCALKQTLLAESKTLSDYAAFWDGDLEANVNQDINMKFVGKVHANGDIFVSKKVEFDRNISCSGSFYHLRKNTWVDDWWNGRNVNIRFGDDNVMSEAEKDRKSLKNTWVSSENRYMDSRLGPEWAAKRKNYYGDAIRTGVDGVRSISPPISTADDNHKLIEKPVINGTDGYDEATENQKFARKAALYLRVDKRGTARLYKGVNEQGFPTEEIKGLDLVSPVVVSNYVSSYTGKWQKNKSTKHQIRIYGKDDAGTYQMSGGNGFFNSEDIWTTEPKTFFVDKRIQWVMKPVDIYLDKMLENDAIRTILDNAEANGKEKILYVEMEDPFSTPVGRFSKNSATEDNPGGVDSTFNWNGQTWPMSSQNNWLTPIPCVRVRNGADLKGYDISVVTSRHLYVEGDFNTRRDGVIKTEVGENGLANAMLAGDTLTTLSKNWQQYHFDPNFSWWDIGENKNFVWDRDAAKALIGQNKSANNSGIVNIVEKCQEKDASPYTFSNTEYQKATETTVNAVVMMGMIPSLTPEVSGNYTQAADKDGNAQNEYYSGGMENAFRWIEKWDGVKLLFNGTILCLYSPHEPEYRWEIWNYSGKHNSGANSGNFYKDWWRAPNRTGWAYRRMTPPGLPNFFSVRETGWDRVAYSSVNWSGAESGGGGGEGGGEEGGG